MLEVFPQGFEEADHAGALELAAYTDAAGAERARELFAEVEVAEVAGGWEDAWREFHQPVRVGPLWIGPPWEQPPADAIAVVIDPGRAFGTGAHATTRLCLDLLTELPRGSLLDVGSGSGVLAIAAAKLGFDPVTALDRDPVAVDAAERNAVANGVRVVTRLGDALRDPLPVAQIALANLELAAFGAVRLDCTLAVTSGYLAEDELGLPGFRHGERRELEGWAADVWERSE
jgi:ribosomal protein L11 methyltransferase